VRRAVSLLLCILLFTGFSSATVTSADSITYDSNSDFFDGTVFAISVASDQATDKIDIHLDKDELSQQVDGEVQQDLTLDIGSQNTELRYSTTQSSELRDIRTVVPYHEEGFSSQEEAVQAIKNKCYDLNGNGEGSGHYDWRVGSLSYEIWCFQESTYLGTPAYLDNPDEIFTTDVRVTAKGKTVQSATLSNGDAGSGVITDLGRHAKVRWNGNLDTGAAKPDNSRVYALHANRYSGSWRIIGQQAYNDYKSYLETEAHNTIQDWAAGQNSGWQAAEWFNNRAWSAAEVDTSSELAYTTVADSSLNSGAFTYDTEDLLVYPMFTVYVDAGENGYIEISKPTGEPEILSTSSTRIEELSTGTISATVRNVGDGEGSFSSRVTGCSDGFRSSDTQRTKTVFPGGSTSFSFDVSFQSTNREQQEITGSCSIEVQDTGSGSTASTSVEVTGVQASQCEAGEQSINVNTDGLYEIYECKDNEQGKVLVETCSSGQKAVAQGDGTFACEETDGGTGGGGGDRSNPLGFLSDLFEGPESGSGILAQIHLGLSLIAGVMTGLVGYKGSRWVDGENRVRGSFSLKSRSVSRVKKGRLVIGVLGGVAAFLLGALVALQIPLLVQLIVIVGTGVLMWKTPLY